MKIRRAFLLAIVACAALADPPPDPKAEWPKKWEALAQKAAREHAAIGKWAAGKKLFNEAYPEYARAAELDPTNAEAQKALGRKLENGAWVDDPKTPPKKGSEAPGADVPGLLEEIGKKRDEAARKLAKEFTTVAEWAQKNGLKEEAAGLWQQIVDRYDPASEKAHLGLGHTKEGDKWIPPEDLAKRETAAKRLKDASQGEVVTEKSEVESALGVSHQKRRSKHYFIEGPYTDAQIAELVQVAEASRVYFLEMFDLGEDSLSTSIHAMVYKEQETYARYVKADPSVPAADKKAYGEIGGYPVLGPLAFAGWQGSKDWDYVRDFVAHMSVHILFLQHFPVFPYPAWLYEGISYWVTDRVLKSARVFCSGFSTSAGGGRTFEDTRGWKAEVKRMERLAQDPDMRELMSGDLNGMNMRRTIKSWSVVEWLLEERKKEFITLVSELRGGSKPEDAVKTALGVNTLVLLDVLWKRYVREKY